MSGTNQHSVALEARRWVVRLDELRGPERAEFDCWLEASDLHRFAFAKAWVRWKNLECLKVLPDDPLAYGESWFQAAANEAYQESSCRPAWPLAFAATLTCISAVAAMLMLPWDYLGDYTTAVGQQMEAGLPDGSAMLVNTGTRPSARFAENAHRAVLESAEAHFEVSREPARPLVVDVGTAVVRAVGTAFTAHMHEEELDVTSLDGEVEIDRRLGSASHSELVTIAAIEPLLHVATAHIARVAHNDIGIVSRIDAETIDRRLAWQHSTLEFVNAPLGQVIADAGLYTDKTLEIVDPELMDYPVTVTVRIDNIDGLLDSLDTSTEAFRVTHISKRRVTVSRDSP